MKFNFKKKNLFLSVLSLMSVFCLMVSSVSGYTETTCEGVSCYDVITPEIVFSIDEYNTMAISSDFPPMNILSSDIFNFVNGNTYDFSISYDDETGIFEFAVNGVIIQTTQIQGLNYDSLTLFNVIQSSRSANIELTQMYLNGNLISDVVTTTGQINGLWLRELNFQQEGLNFYGVIMIEDLGSGDASYPLVNFLLSDSSVLIPIPDLEVIAGVTTTHTEEVSIDLITSILGGISVKLLETNRQSLSFGELLIWENIVIDYVTDFEVLIFPTNTNPNLQSLNYVDVFETSESIIFGEMTTPNSFVTWNINDGFGIDGFAVTSSEEESLLLVSAPSNVDVWVVF